MSLSDRLASLIEAAAQGRLRLADLQDLEEELLEDYEVEALQAPLTHYLAAVEQLYDHLTQRNTAFLWAAEHHLAEGYRTMHRCEALWQRAREELQRPLERGVA